MASNSSNGSFIRTLSEILDGIGVVFENASYLQQLLRELGWKTSFDSASLSAIEGVLSFNVPIRNTRQLLVQIDQGGADDAAIAQGLFSISKGLYESIKNIATMPTAGLAYPFDQPGFMQQLADELIPLLLKKYLSANFPTVYGLLYFTGIIDSEEVFPQEAGRLPYTRYSIHWDRILKTVSNPPGLFEEVYGWNTTEFKYTRFLDALETFFEHIGLHPLQVYPSAALHHQYYEEHNHAAHSIKSLEIPLFLGGNPQWTAIVEMGVIVLPIPAKTDTQSASPVGFAILPMSRGRATAEMLDDNSFFSMGISGSFSTEGAFRIDIRPEGVEASLDPSVTNLDGRIGIQASPPSPWILVGDTESSHFAINSFSAGLEIKGLVNDPEFIVGINQSQRSGQQNSNLTLVLNFGSSDGFLQTLFGSEPQRFDLGLGFSWSSKHGFLFNGQVGLEIRLPAHVSLGPISINDFFVSLKAVATPPRVETSVGAGFGLKLGPLAIVVENIGLKLNLKERQAGELVGTFGDLNMDFSFKPPNGVGLSLDTGIVKGGGYLYFDFDKEEYAGVLELAIAGIVTVKAIGLITTKMPDGSKGFSLLIIITAEFGTGIQLGFGFTLIGVGGLLGLNRTMLLEPLAAGIRTGAINSIMFPPNPVQNAPRIISDLRTYFPPYEGKFLIGPMVKIGWGTPTLVSLSFGLIIEIPGNIAIVGVLSLNLPTVDAPIVAINVAFLGALEFDKKRIWFFASLFDSRILFLTLEGDMGLLMDYGDNPNFVLTVGGFHPLFSPPPLPFPNPRRIHIGILNKSFARITVESYFAVTSNTVQFGASAELFFGLSVVSIRGYFSFDALFQFSPFKFIIQMSFSVSLEVFGFGLFSIRLRLQLEGPTPWRAQGTGTLTIDLWLFEINISADFDVTWGDAEDTTLPSVEVLPLLAAELDKIDNWRVITPPGNNLLVSVRKLEEQAGVLLLHPVGALQINQRAVPLHLKIDKVGNRKAADAHLFDVKADSPGLSKSPKVFKEKFAIAQFQDMSNDQKLSRPAFQDFDSGIELSVTGRQLGSSKVTRRVVRYETIIIDTNYKRLSRKWFSKVSGIFNHFLLGSAITKCSLSYAVKKERVPFGPDDRITVDQVGYTVSSIANNKILEGTSVFANEALAHDYLQYHLANNPGMIGELHIIPEKETIIN